MNGRENRRNRRMFCQVSLPTPRLDTEPVTELWQGFTCKQPRKGNVKLSLRLRKSHTVKMYG
jgi:hypothetical protein